MAFEMLRVRTVLTGLVQGGGVSTIYLRSEASKDPNTAISVVNAFWEAARSGISSQVSIAVQNTVDEIDGTGALVQQYVGTAVPGKQGGAAGATLPPATQGLLRMTTPTVVGGRRLRGRLFIPGPVSGPEGGVTAPEQAYINDINAAGAGLIAGAEAAQQRWVVWSRKNASYAPVTGTTVWNKYAVLRSRRD